MSRINQEDLIERKNLFFSKLDNLIAEFPELIQPPVYDEDDPFCDLHKEESGTMKMVTGIVVILTTKNDKDWENVMFTAPYAQSAFFTRGMVNAALDMM